MSKPAPPPPAPSWPAVLRTYTVAGRPLIPAAVLHEWTGRPWVVGLADKRAAARLHIQMASWVSTQELGYSEGTEAAALASIYSLFGTLRTISEAEPLAHHFNDVAWVVLNCHVRPFTAKWHRRSEQGALDGLDATDDFRAELQEIQEVLRIFDALLLEIRDGERRTVPVALARRDGVAAEMDKVLPFGIDADLEEAGAEAEARNQAERIAVERRRAQYGVRAGASDAVGLAISGGGIRSATFSIGVLAALAKRQILPQVDYLSTVSGGGYVGAFLAAFLSSPRESSVDPIGLRRDDLPFRSEPRESAPLGHIRQNSRYLTAQSFREQMLIGLAQLSGLLVNFLTLASAIAVAGLIAGLARIHVFPAVAMWLVSGLAVLLVAMLLLQLAVARLGPRPKVEGFTSGLTFFVALALMAVVSWAVLGALQEVFEKALAASPSTPFFWISIFAGPLLALAVGALSERLLGRYRILSRLLVVAAGPLLLLNLLLAAQWLAKQPTPSPSRGLIAAAIISAILMLIVDVNHTGLHRHYRRKLAGTFLIRPGKTEGTIASGCDLKLSALRGSSAAPYPIINAAVNLPSSNCPSMRGRLSDFFSFTPDYCGSPVTGFARTTDWEKANPDLTLGAAMAISGAAASPQMGLHTRAPFSFWLTLFNVRLNYWIRRPDRGPRSYPGAWRLWQEMFGIGTEDGAALNLSDGGHIENLGVYELLRRRCKYILAIDGEQDPGMTFHAITNLQRLAALDLNTRIDIDLDDLRLNERGVSPSHFRLCRIRYPGKRIGYLLYMKLSLTGNEGEFIRRFRLDEPDFPHHSTANQFFTETQFEAYRSLGEHVGEKLFLRAVLKDLADEAKPLDIETWFARIGESFLEPLRR